MSRSLTAAYLSALASGNIIYIFLIDMFFDSATTRFALAPYNVSWNGNTYTGVATIAGIESIKEAGEMEATGMTFQIVANAAMISIAMNENIQGRKVVMRMALLDSNHQIIDTPLVCFQGRLDTMSIGLGKTGVIKVTAESRFAAWDTAKVRRFNSPDQQVRYPTDTFFDFVPQMVAKELPWGVPSAAVPQAAVVDVAVSMAVSDEGGGGRNSNDGNDG